MQFTSHQWTTTQCKSPTNTLRGIFVAAAFAIISNPALPIVGGTTTTLLAISATPAHAECLLNGEIHGEIANKDCREAQRTGCVRSMLSAGEYKRCLSENRRARRAGKACIIDGRMYSEFSAEDCVEAKETGCVRRLLSNAEYEACLDKQRDL